jgi:hypothetical protein
MRLADEIIVDVGGGALRLRPTLRAALRLERRHGGFDKLFAAVADGNLGVIRDLITETATDPRLAVLNLFTSPLRVTLEALVPHAIALVLALAGVDSEAKPEPTTEPSKPVSFEEFHTRLFEIGTGWLGWSPEATWNATPAEILAAYKGRMDLLGAIFGTPTSDANQAGPTPLPTQTERAASLATLRSIA